MSTKPSIVSPPIGTGISGSCRMAAPMSADSAVGSATTSSTSAVQLSVPPESSAARDQRARGIARRRALAQDVGDALVGQEPVHAVAAQQEAVVQRHRLAA